MSDVEKWIRRAQKGDAQAFGRLFDRFSNDIFRYALSRMYNRHAAEDVTAETFKKTWENIRKYKHKNFRAYLYTIAHNLIIDFYRKSSRLERIGERDFEANQENVEDGLYRTQQQKRLAATIRKLGKMEREVVRLRFVEELGAKEAAKVLGKSAVWVRVTQFRTLRKLRKILDET